eukprot:CAMPEP_0183334744 /NCGR_PEP_ID=MMETSP0164_2-20130417/3247_1 /TAXON_ID=221442 /ORGANISM="Coccolithus pelagicus ssp braarudi, Strain PLY182g" /LENGTH=343 /DNA_ID=CAMNT_0025503945 /DNA_START=92 /DNA_END=1124 /DNA_ORIENTATION=-
MHVLFVGMVTTAPFQWFGAAPTREPLALHRRGWDACAICGGAERLGAVVPIQDLRELDAEGVAAILDAVRAHGVVVVKGQNLTRTQQVALTDALGETLVLPKSFEGQDPEPYHPAIQRVTNFWANGTWKGSTTKFGAYWHQDGQFWQAPHHHILSILHAQAMPPAGGETGFADLRAARATLSAPLLERAANASIRASVRDIADFAKGDEADLRAFPDANHPLLDTHVLDNGPLLYVGSPHMEVVGLETPEAGQALLTMLLAHATSPAFTYFHSWDVGDMLIWDNTQTLHHSFPYNNNGSARRELYRTQARLRLPESLAKEELEGGQGTRMIYWQSTLNMKFGF